MFNLIFVFRVIQIKPEIKLGNVNANVTFQWEFLSNLIILTCKYINEITDYSY